MRPLVIGDYVFVQNQSGNHKLRWDRSGQVVKVNGFDQYTVKLEGSRRLTIRNRKFLRKFNPYIPPGWAQQADEVGLPTPPLATTPTAGPPATPPQMTGIGSAVLDGFGLVLQCWWVMLLAVGNLLGESSLAVCW